jgi:hypothetical protein
MAHTLPAAHQVGKHRQRLLNVGVGRGPVHLVKVDMIGLQAAQRRLHRLRDPAARTALLIWILTHCAVNLGGKHDIVATTLQRLADNLLRLAVAVSVGGVDEVDAEIQALVDDADAGVVIGVGHAAEHHRTQAIGADLDAGPA